MEKQTSLVLNWSFFVLKNEPIWQLLVYVLDFCRRDIDIFCKNLLVCCNHVTKLV